MTAVTKQQWLMGAGVLAAMVLVALLAGWVRPGGHDVGKALVGEARSDGLMLDLPQAVRDVAISEARVPGRPIVLIDPGHGGRDPGATGVSGTVQEKVLALALATDLRDMLVKRGRVRVALTRTDDRTLDLDQRADLARRIGAAMFVSIHLDHAPNPLARGVTVYSLSDVASSAEAAQFAQSENRAGGAAAGGSDGSVRALLADLALRGQMEESAALAQRIVRRSAGPVLLRPRPHQFAAFHVLRRAAAPSVLVEAGYISNVDDEAQLASSPGRAGLVLALAQAIEADMAVRRR